MCVWELLGDGCGVYLPPSGGFTTDALLLARFSQPRPGEACADVGAGTGVISMLWAARGNPASVLALELQEDLAELARRGAAKNGFEQVVTVVRGDLRDYRSLLPHQGLDRIACNPPYFPPGTGKTGEGPRKTARHEEGMGLGTLTAAAAFSLRDGGRLCLCQRTTRMAEILSEVRNAGLEPKRLRLVQSTPNKPPYLFLLECRKAGGVGLTLEPVLLLNDENGRPTAELTEMYGGYRNA